jgi:putative SOS response-associated peptidase YedK
VEGDRGKAITSFAIVTPAAAPSVARYHNRMPVVLDDSQFN